MCNTLTLHKNNKPLTVTGRTSKELLSNLRHWLILREDYVSGLTCEGIATLLYDRGCKKWGILWLDISILGYFEWGRAVKAFVDICSHNICEVTE